MDIQEGGIDPETGAIKEQNKFGSPGGHGKLGLNKMCSDSGDGFLAGNDSFKAMSQQMLTSAGKEAVTKSSQEIFLIIY